VCGGQIVIVTGLYVGVWWTDCYRDRFICGCMLYIVIETGFLCVYIAQIVTGTGFYEVVWWTDCYMDRFVCGRVLDRLL